MSIDTLQYYISFIVWPAFLETLLMLAVILVLAFIFGLALAVILYTTSPIGFRPAPRINRIVGATVNVMRSFPVIIFIILLFPLSRAVLGSAIGIKAGIFYLVLASIPFVARILEGNLREVNPDLLFAAKAMGFSDRQIMLRIVIHEAVPAMVSSFTFCAIIILGSISIAGMVGSGGIGTVALNHGYKTFNKEIMYLCILIMAALVGMIQLCGNILYKKLK